MSSPVSIVTLQTPWIWGGTYSGINQGLSAFDTYSLSASEWTSSGKRIVFALPTEPNAVKLQFFGKGGNGKVGTARLWGISKDLLLGGGYDYLGVPLAEVNVALGSKTLTGGNFGGATWYVGQTITVVQDGTNTPPGIRLIGNGLGGFANMIFDTIGCYQIVVELLNPTDQTTELGFHYQPL